MVIQHPHNPNITAVYKMLCFQGVLDKIKLKIQKLEKAIQAQKDQCKDPCITKCPIPVVSGKWRRKDLHTD